MCLCVKIVIYFFIVITIFTNMSELEDDKFVKNVIHQLSALKKNEKQLDNENHVGHSSEVAEKSNHSLANEVAQDCIKLDHTQTAHCDHSKPPSRIVRLSRSLHSSNYIKPSASPEANLATVSLSQSTNYASCSAAVNGTSSSQGLSLTVGNSGSRLAALQRPGSPMHKLLQRTQSPGLSVAARIPRNPSEEISSDLVSKRVALHLGTRSGEPEQQLGGVSEHNNAGTCKLNENNNHATNLSPNIQSSTGSGSILLRRPKSPPSTNHSGDLLNKTTGSGSVDSSTNSSTEGLDDPRSPKQFSESFDENLSSDKAAIRNKLRANSFRLKDLLTKRPNFVGKSKEDCSDNSEEICNSDTRNESRIIPTNVKGVNELNEIAEHSGNDLSKGRTRWRDTKHPTLSRSKSSVSENTVMHISSRYQKHDGNTSEINAYNKIANLDREQSSMKEGVATFNSNTNIETNNVSEAVSATVVTRNDQNIDDNNKTIKSVQGSRGRLGATLLCSSRTRNATGISNVPYIEKLHKLTAQPGIIKEGECAISQEPMTNERRLYDLEKEKDVNLVFDSKDINSLNCNDLSEQIHGEPVTSHRSAKEVKRVQTEFSGFPEDECDSYKHRNYSEPDTPQKDQPSGISGSKSFDNAPDADFSRSATLKRSMVVTDLDKAMIDRDKQKLIAICKDNVHGVANMVDAKSQSQHSLEKFTGHQETDLDAHRPPAHRSHRSSIVQQRSTGSQDGQQSSLHNASLHTKATPALVYKSNVNLEDAVKWPVDSPGKLDFKEREVFEGDSNYLRLVMTKHDINVIACQFSTCLLAAGVMKQIERNDLKTVFKSEAMYFWTHTQTDTQHVNKDGNKLTPMWPRTLEDIVDNKPGLKYTEADHQAAMVTVRNEYKEELDKKQRENQGELDRARQEYEMRLQQAVERIAALQLEVEKYKCLAGMEMFTQKALSAANAAQLEAGLLALPTNGYTCSTPLSEYHTPAASPDGTLSDFSGSCVKSALDFTDVTAPSTPQRQSEDETSSQGDGSSLGDIEGIPAPPPAPLPPPPAPPLPCSSLPKKSLKPIVNPKSPMKPLFWQRIQVNDIKTPKHKEYYEKRLVWEEIEEAKIDFKELDKLFSKSSIEPSRKFCSNKPNSRTNQFAKVISPKRSQTVGILLSGLRLEMSDIEHVILTFDTSQLAEDKLRQIYENRGEEEELKLIQDHIQTHPDIPLDKPDQFLYDLSLIPNYSERIFCFIFREAFQDSISVMETKMTNLRMTCQTLMTSIAVKQILGLVLALGNYMNGGSESRGQADGFNIEILPKLKDAKSKDNSTSLLHFTVHQYIEKFEKQDAGTEKVKFPLIDPSDLQQASQVYFEELEKELLRIQKDFKSAEQRAEKVIHSAHDIVYLQPFKDIMTEFFEKGKQEFIEQEENLAFGKKLFQETVIFFCAIPKSGEKEVTPEYFFSLWCSFCQDFKDLWKREQQKIMKQRIKENEIRLKQRQQRIKQPIRTRERTRGGLKDKLSKQGLLQP